MASFSLPAVLLLDIAGAGIAAATLLAVHIPDPPAGPATERTVLRDLHSGLVELRRNRPLLALSTVVLIASIAYMPVGSLYPLMVRDHFGGTAWHASAVEALFAGGLLASSLVVGIFGGMRDKVAMILWSLAALGATLVAAGLLPPTAFVAFAVVSTLTGMIGSFFGIPYTAFVQSTIPPGALGRVLTLVTSLMSLAIPLGLLAAGPVAELVGVASWFVISGVTILLAAALGWFVVPRPAAGAEGPAAEGGERPAM